MSGSLHSVPSSWGHPGHSVCRHLSPLHSRRTFRGTGGPYCPSLVPSRTRGWPLAGATRQHTAGAPRVVARSPRSRALGTDTGKRRCLAEAQSPSPRVQDCGEERPQAGLAGSELSPQSEPARDLCPVPAAPWAVGSPSHSRTALCPLATTQQGAWPRTSAVPGGQRLARAQPPMKTCLYGSAGNAGPEGLRQPRGRKPLRPPTEEETRSPRGHYRAHDTVLLEEQAGGRECKRPPLASADSAPHPAP